MDVAMLNLTLGSAQRKFLYRKGTGDEDAIVRTLKKSIFNFGPLRRANELSSLYEQLVRAGKVPLIVDAGAGIGASAVYFASSFPGARLVVVEPDRRNFDLLATNTTGLPVECIHAMAASAGTPAEQGNGSRSRDPAVVPAMSFNEIYELHAQGAVPFIVKIGVDRSDGDLFAENTEWIDRTPVIIVQLSDPLIPGTAKVRAFVECIESRNRDFVYHLGNIFSIARELPVG